MQSRWIWLLVVAIVIGVIALATSAAPGALSDGDQRLRLIYLCVILAALSGGLAARLQAKPGTAIAQLGTWAVVFAALILIYSYRDQFNTLRDRFTAELLPAKGEQTGPTSIAFALESDGHYHVYGAVNGTSIRFLVDSGSSDIVFSPEDARMLGMQPEYLDYTMTAQTANGQVRGAPMQIATLKVGPIVMHDVPATVNQAEMPVSLLGMEFLRRLKAWGRLGVPSRRPSLLKVVPVAAMLLSACATDDATFIRQNGTVPESKKLEADTKDCGHVGTSASGYFGGALHGAAGGAYLGAAEGGASGGTGLDALASAALGFLVGTVTGAFGAASGDNYDLYMARKGYQRVDAQQAEAEATPVIVRRAGPQPSSAPQPAANDPAP